MHINKIILSILILFIPVGLISQSHYQVDLAGFSSKKFAEFCPVIFNNQIVFTSNQETELLIDNRNKNVFNIFKVNIDPDNWDSQPEVFSQSLLTPYNDGPASFSPDGKMVAYSRNVDTKTKNKNIFDPKNTLGLYFAELDEGEWINSTDFKYNSVEYSITTPCFSPDGNYLYFGSDMPGGYGGTDLYRSTFINGEWAEPVNLGKRINTKGNEVYPFIAENGDLFFASDGHGGLGKKDIFLSRYSGIDWITPVHLDPPINSKEDDFGLITDEDFSTGFFSSSRGRTDDIYQFTTLVPQLFDCDTLLENLYCYEFWDELYPEMNSLPVIYEWEFSDGTIKSGLRVEHCFPGAGKYWAKLNIIDNSITYTFYTQTSMEFELVDHIQAYITCNDVGIIESDMEFSGLKSYLPGYNTEEYVWDFGDGNFNTGPDIIHQFNEPGIYDVKMGVKDYSEGSENKELRCVVRPVTILPDNQALAMFLSGTGPPVLEESANLRRDTTRSDQNISISEFIPAAESQRYATSRVKIYVLAKLPDEVVARIKRGFAEFESLNFEFNQSEVSENFYPVLDRMAIIMKEIPDLAMEIAAHTDDVGSSEFNMELSEKRAQSIVDYLISNGIDNERLIGKGYSESRPISSNSTEGGRTQNRRVEFIILIE